MSTRKSETMRVSEVMLPMGRFPVVAPSLYLKEALEEMGRWRLGIVCIVAKDGTLAGILTDGDIRRRLLKIQKPFSAFFADDVIDHAVQSPVTIGSDANLVEAVRLMETKQIWDLPALDAGGKVVGLLHLHPVVQVLLGLGD